MHGQPQVPIEDTDYLFERRQQCTGLFNRYALESNVLVPLIAVKGELFPVLMVGPSQERKFGLPSLSFRAGYPEVQRGGLATLLLLGTARLLRASPVVAAARAPT